ncbi:MAG: alpha/beta fold hydrolase [Gammaproteobacteria bacterium]|nr:alpha/beta fold hydrolase [Gammaproteobacteria bacterium]
MASTGLTTVLLPGLDGTGRMFDPLIAQLPDSLCPRVIAYPTQHMLNYAQLTDYVLSQLPVAEPFVLIAESFAGPLALQISTRIGPNLSAMVLCATFVSNPRPYLAWLAPLLLHESLVSITPPKWLVRYLGLGFDTPDALLNRVLAVHKQVAAQVFQHRLQEVIRMDVRELWRQCRRPMLHLYATHDHTVPLRASREMQRLRPDIPSIGIDGPHLLLQTRARQCAALIEKFLKEEIGLD